TAARPVPRGGVRGGHPRPAEPGRVLRVQGRGGRFIRALAAELGGTGITANAVSPGSTDTAMLAESARMYGLPDAAAFGCQQPIGRLLDPAEIARVLAFLASDAASGLTGAAVPVHRGLAL